MDRTILHCDCNAFYASVECVLNPELKKVPMAVGGDEESRHGIILAKNELAKKYNIQTAETIWQAKKKCPDLVIVRPHHDLYYKYSKQVMDIYKRYTDYVESFGPDEAWLDVTGSKRLFGDGVKIANELRRIVREETGLTISVGVSFCKVFAKLGSDYKKPDATTVFSKSNWKQFIYPLSVRDLLFVGKKTGDELERLGVKTIGQLAKYDEHILVRHFGKAGNMLYRYANGLDSEPVKSIYEKEKVKSVGNGMTAYPKSGTEPAGNGANDKRGPAGCGRLERREPRHKGKEQRTEKKGQKAPLGIRNRPYGKPETESGRPKRHEPRTRQNRLRMTCTRPA